MAGIQAEEMEALVAERERGGPYRSSAELASRSGASRDALERLAWAGACDELARDRRAALWELGVAARRGPATQGQLGLALEPGPAPELRSPGSWELLLADYASTGISLDRHPMELLREELEAGRSSGAPAPVPSPELGRLPDGARVRVAGLVVARQRPATARGVVFVLLEDEWGTVNAIVPPPVYERHRLVVRTASFLVVTGRLERREGVTNLIADSLEEIETPAAGARARVAQIEPPPERETGRDLAAVAPRAHSFGRRGR